MLESLLIYNVIGLIIFLTALMEDRVTAASNKVTWFDFDYGVTWQIFVYCIITIFYVFFWPLISIVWMVHKLIIK